MSQKMIGMTRKKIREAMDKKTESNFTINQLKPISLSRKMFLFTQKDAKESYQQCSY